VDLLSSIISSPSTSINSPKLSSKVFEMKNNYFVVTDGNSYNYYTIKVKPIVEGSTLIHFDRSPPVIMEGIAIVDKKMYKVPIQDLLRRIIRTSREIKIEVKDESTSSGNTDATVASITSTTKTKSTPVSSKLLSDSVQSGIEQTITVEEHSAADSTWEEQIGSLLDFISKEEGEDWEITETP